jgi:sugar lactone lactonase YvrE
MTVAFETPAVEIVTAVRSQVGESPLWSVAEQALWWVDIEGRRLHRLDPATAETATWPVDERIGCIGLHRDGGFIAALETGIFRLDPKAGGALVAERLAIVEHPQDGMRFNDGRVDRSGRFWSATMVRDMSLGARSVRSTASMGEDSRRRWCQVLATGNGLAFSADGRTLYLSDSHPSVQKIWAFDLAADGCAREPPRLSSTWPITRDVPTAPRSTPTAATGPARPTPARCSASRRRAGSTAR